ncbi:MAG: hypothetical protein ACREVY_17670, partial [Gammaproteobacteria bacterium]
MLTAAKVLPEPVQGTRIGFGEGGFQIADGASLDLPQARLVERRELLEAGAQWRGLRYPLRQRLGPEEVENLPATRRGVEAVGEVGHRAVGL